MIDNASMIMVLVRPGQRLCFSNLCSRVIHVRVSSHTFRVENACPPDRAMLQENDTGA
jgi:hypothetical protein